MRELPFLIAMIAVAMPSPRNTRDRSQKVQYRRVRATQPNPTREEQERFLPRRFIFAEVTHFLRLRGLSFAARVLSIAYCVRRRLNCGRFYFTSSLIFFVIFSVIYSYLLV